MEEYLDLVNAGSTDPHPYDRLMIQYRKEKNYKEELAIIKKAITVFEKQIADHRPILLQKKNAKTTALKTLSKQISQKMGLVDKKGNAVYVPEPIARWKKRQATVEKKIKALK